MHCVNCSIFFSTFLSSASHFLTTTTKRRLLEWKVWNDMAMYVSRNCPRLLLDEITHYQPKQASGWDAIFQRVNELEDDGHASKLIRALAHGEQVCAKYENKEGFVIRGHDAWLKLGHMAIDSVEAEGPDWVFSCGFEEAWASIPLRDGGALRRL